MLHNLSKYIRRIKGEKITTFNRKGTSSRDLENKAIYFMERKEL